jgi:hypothetical protein
MNRRAPGIASHAIITRPADTTAPARVPGIGIFPSALSVAGPCLSFFGSVNISSLLTLLPSLSDPSGETVLAYFAGR